MSTYLITLGASSWEKTEDGTFELCSNVPDTPTRRYLRNVTSLHPARYCITSLSSLRLCDHLLKSTDICISLFVRVGCTTTVDGCSSSTRVLQPIDESSRLKLYILVFRLSQKIGGKRHTYGDSGLAGKH